MRSPAKEIGMRQGLSIATLCLLLSGAPALAGTLAGVTLPDSVQVGDRALQLNGLGLRKKLFIKVYVAALYVATQEKDAAAVLAADAPRRGVMKFLFGVDKDKICEEGWMAGLSANTPGASADLKAKFATLCGYMEDMASGEELSYDYLPGSGTHITVKGKAKGNIEGKDFADALLACWIGPKPGPGQDFKKALLGG
jgi:hypothetical protein